MINHVVFTIDSLTKNKNYPKQLLNHLYLIASGMILNYGEDYINDIYDAILKTDFIITNKGNSYDINKYSFYTANKDNYFKKTIEIKENLSNIDVRYNLYVDTLDAPIKLLEYLTYELNYILFNKSNKLSLKENLKVGFNFLTKRFTNTLSDSDEILLIDQLYNSLQTEDIIKQILSLNKENIKNRNFVEALSLFKKIDDKIYSIGGLSILVNLVRPVYNCEEIKKLINSFNRKKDIEHEFDKKLGANAYKDLCKRIETLNLCLSKSNGNTSYYLLATEYLTIRNNYINRYLKKIL